MQPVLGGLAAAPGGPAVGLSQACVCQAGYKSTLIFIALFFAVCSQNVHLAFRAKGVPTSEAGPLDRSHPPAPFQPARLQTEVTQGESKDAGRRA